tara:strand:+ start:4481 stop:5401 length:921 start_codon:yes stop_codon:yes gene_type:complete
MKNKTNSSQHLGKGIEALIRDNSTESKDNANLFIELNKIIPNKKNPRKNFNKVKLEELKESIYQHGILQPLTVRKIEENKYELIAGGRRYEAMLQLSKEYEDERFKQVPIFIKTIESESLMTELALIENLQRSDLNPIEEALAYFDLKSSYSMSDQQIADSVSKSRSSISNSIRLLKFQESDSGKLIIDALKKLEVTVGQVRPLIDLKPATQAAIFKKIKSKNLTARQIEKEVKKYKDLKPEMVNVNNSYNSDDWEQLVGIYKINLSNHLSTSVDIKRNQSGKGQIVVHYQNEDELADIIKNKILK